MATSSAVKPVQFMPPAIVKTMFDRKMGGPGNWFIAVNGLYVPAERVMMNLPEPDIDRLRFDPREPAQITYPLLGAKEYFLEFDLASYQQIFEQYVYGKTIVDYVDTNTNRQVGNIAHSPAQTSEAEWFLLKLDAVASTTHGATIPRLDFQGHDPASVWLSTRMVNQPTENPVVGNLLSAYSQGYDGINGEWIGRLKLHGAFPDAFTYDSNQAYSVMFGNSDQLLIDWRHIDPNLQDGDDCCLVGIAYKFLQLSGVSSYSFKWNMFEAAEVPIDMYMSLGPALRSNVILSRHIPRANLINIPDFGQTTGDENTHNRRTFRFEIIINEPQNETVAPLMSDLFQESINIVPR